MLQVLHEFWDFVIGGIRVLQTHNSSLLYIQSG